MVTSTHEDREKQKEERRYAYPGRGGYGGKASTVPVNAT